MKKYFKRDGGKDIKFVEILNELLTKGIVGWLEYDDEASSLEKKSLKLVENSRYFINNGVPKYSQSTSVIFNTKDSTLAIEAKSEKDTIPMYYQFKVTDSDLEELFEGTIFEFKKF